MLPNDTASGWRSRSLGLIGMISEPQTDPGSFPLDDQKTRKELQNIGHFFHVSMELCKKSTLSGVGRTRRTRLLEAAWLLAAGSGSGCGWMPFC